MRPQQRAFGTRPVHRPILSTEWSVWLLRIDVDLSAATWPGRCVGSTIFAPAQLPVRYVELPFYASCSSISCSSLLLLFLSSLLLYSRQCLQSTHKLMSPHELIMIAQHSRRLDVEYLSAARFKHALKSSRPHESTSMHREAGFS